MKYLLTILLVALVGCGATPTDGTLSVNLGENFSQCNVRVNGTTVFVELTGLNPYRVALDGTFVPSVNVTYLDVFEELTIIDAKRITPLTALETSIINGTQ